ncbi:MAG: hypothetical protein ACRDAI_06340 [Candidatus Rhabdochlamydia sp.]
MLAKTSEIFIGLRIREAIYGGLESISEAFSREQELHERIFSLKEATFLTLWATSSLITLPLSLAHRAFIAINKPNKKISFDEAINLYKEDRTLGKVDNFIAKIIYYPIKSSKNDSLKAFKENGGLKNRFKVSTLIVTREFAKSLTHTAWTINSLSLGMFHTIGSIFSKKCDANKGLYLVNSIQTLEVAAVTLLFMPATTACKLYQANCSFKIKDN